MSGQSTCYSYEIHKYPYFASITNRTPVVNHDGDVQDQAGGYAERAHRDQCDGSIILCSAQCHAAIIVSLRRCYLDVHSRRTDDGCGPYGESVVITISSASGILESDVHRNPLTDTFFFTRSTFLRTSRSKLNAWGRVRHEHMPPAKSRILWRIWCGYHRREYGTCWRKNGW